MEVRLRESIREILVAPAEPRISPPLIWRSGWRMTLEPLLLPVILRLLPSLAMVWKSVPAVSAILMFPVE